VITVETFSEAIAPFRDDTFRFSPSPENDDVWLEIDFQDEAFERSVGEYIVRLLAKRYKPLADPAEIQFETVRYATNWAHAPSRESNSADCSQSGEAGICRFMPTRNKSCMAAKSLVRHALVRPRSRKKVETASF